MNVIKWNGRPISKPGWYSGIPLERYHGAGMCAGPAVSSTDLRTCWAKSPAHAYLHWAENPKREPRTITRAMTLGAAAHHILLGDPFKQRYVAQPPTYRDTTTAIEKQWHGGARYCKQWTEKQEKAGKTIVTLAELATIVAMSQSLSLAPVINDGLLRGHIEISGFFKDEETGLWIKVRPDVVPKSDGDFVDLKTAFDVTTPAVQSVVRSRGYHQQGALIWDVSEHLEHPFQAFVLVFVETSAPYCARCVPLPDDDVARGRLQNRAMLRKIANCINANHWPGPGEGDTRELPLAHEERQRIDARLKYEGLS